MERSLPKLGIVLFVTILVPSLMLTALALKAVSKEQVRQSAAQLARSESQVQLFARSLDLAFFEARNDLLALLDRVQPSFRSLEQCYDELRELERREPLLSGLFVLDPQARRRYPVTNRKPGDGLSLKDQALDRIIRLSDGGLFGAYLGSQDSSARLLERARALRNNDPRGALAGFNHLLGVPEQSVRFAAALEASRIELASGHSERALELLRPARSAELSLRGPLGIPVVAEARIELALIFRQQNRQEEFRRTITSLLEQLEQRSLLLPPTVIEEVSRRAALLLDLPDSLFEPLFRGRRKVEAANEDLDLVFGRDFQRVLRELAQRKSPAESPQPTRRSSDLSSAGGAPPGQAHYLKHRVENSYQVVLYAAISDSRGRLLGLCGFLVDLDRFVTETLAPRVKLRNQQDQEIRLVAANPLFNDPEAQPRSSEEDHFVHLRLTEPLDHIELRAFLAQVTEGMVLGGEKINLYVWIITMSMLGIALGIIVTGFAMRRESRAAALKTDFVANVTHELKTPLTSIRLFIETLELDHIESEEERRECLAIMARETDRLTRLIDRLLSFSKLDRRQWKFKLTYADPQELIRDAIQLFRSQFGLEDVEIKVEQLQKTGMLTVDREAMIEVIFNLVHNAWKYTPKKGREIRVTVAERRASIDIAIIDNGVGIPRRDRRRVFEKFERGSYAERSQIEGSGIGLTLARSIVRGHGGDLSYQPNKPSGSRFIITLPK